MASALAVIVAATPHGAVTFLQTERGRSFSAKSFGNWFRERCNEAGLPHCSAHGLRKAGAVRAAEGGATVNQLMAVFDWLTPDMAIRYTEKASRRRLAGQTMSLLECPTDLNPSVPPAILP
jgi:integrase